MDQLNWPDRTAVDRRSFAPHCSDGSRLDVAVTAARKSSWLLGQPTAFVERLIASGSLRHYQKGRIVIEFDQQDQSLHFLVDGAIDVCVPRSTGELLPIHLIAPRHWFGELGALTGQRCFAEYCARIDSTSLCIPRHAIVSLAAETPFNHGILMELLSRAVRNLLWASGDLTGLDPTGRVMSKLLTLTGSDTSDGVEEGQTLSISQSELGAACCLSRSTMNLILAKLEKAGLVRVGYRKIVVLRRAGLLAALKEER